MRMNTENIFNIAKENTPNVRCEVMPGALRHDVISGLKSAGNFGIELGVARGIFSKRMIDSGKFAVFFGVDIYGDIHDTDEYKRTLKYIGLNSNYHLLRMGFEDALDVFEDEFFDFIYIDGFAHTGEEGGRTLIDWYQKLKVGGVMAGDDYHDDWPLVKWAINDFVKKTEVELKVTGGYENNPYCNYPSWFFVKSSSRLVKPNDLLIKVAQAEKQRIHRIRMGAYPNLRNGVIKILERCGLKEPLKRLLKR